MKSAKKTTPPSQKWIVYILKCADSTLYTGITNNLEKRLEKHTSGTGAKYTRGRAPFEVVFIEHHKTKSDALKRELAIKNLSRADKLELQLKGKPKTNNMADSKIISLNKKRKEKARTEKEQAADANRRKYGRTKEEKLAEKKSAEKAKTYLDGHKLDVVKIDFKPKKKD